MKGKIFIAWSGSKDIANEVKKQLHEENYVGVVGGETGNETGYSVGETVLKEIDGCHQAIFLMQKKDAAGISNNVFFELGYALSRFKSKKIHISYIDIQRGDKMIPSDLEGTWATYISSGETHDETAGEIVKNFLTNQKNIVPENKMNIINSHYHNKVKIVNYFDAPYCSEFEFAQYVLMYSQSAYMFRCEADGLADIRNLYARANERPTPELDCALRFGELYLSLFGDIKSNETCIYLEKEYFRKYRKELNRIVEIAERWFENDYTCWLLAIVYDTLNYIHVLYASVPGTDTDVKKKALLTSIDYGNKFFEYSRKLEENEHKDQNRMFLSLYNAYIYRNFYTAYDALNAIEPMDDVDEKKEYNMRMSLEERKELLSDYKRYHSTNTRLLDNFEMEYFLALSEYLDYIDDEDDREDAIDDCHDYVKRVKNMQNEQNFFVNKIERSIRDL